MRTFNKEEEAILEYIVNFPKQEFKTEREKRWVWVRDLFERMAHDLAAKIEINVKERTVSLRSDKFGYREVDGEKRFVIYENWGEHISKKIHDTEYQITLILSLLDYLEKNHLIYIFPLDAHVEVEDVITLNKEYEFKDPDFIPSTGNFLSGGGSKYDYIYENINDSIVPTPELIEFVVHGFKDKEQIRHDQNLTLQWVSVIVALALGILSVVEDPVKEFFGLVAKDDPAAQRNVVTNNRSEKGNSVPQRDVISNNKVEGDAKINAASKKTAIPMPKLVLPDTSRD